ncbi:hypothetical protein DQ353_11985 [Arthrobacter sp. AQ5-05]|nr:hypothetical protein DQ353_11985 [Arthrobacter sp. AQ5-05]
MAIFEGPNQEPPGAPDEAGRQVGGQRVRRHRPPPAIGERAGTDGPGFRVCTSQRILQAVSDPFPGFVTRDERAYHLRQFHDRNIFFDLEALDAGLFTDYVDAWAATLCRHPGPRAPPKPQRGVHRRLPGCRRRVRHGDCRLVDCPRQVIPGRLRSVARAGAGRARGRLSRRVQAAQGGFSQDHARDLSGETPHVATGLASFHEILAGGPRRGAWQDPAPLVECPVGGPDA